VPTRASRKPALPRSGADRVRHHPSHEGRAAPPSSQVAIQNLPRANEGAGHKGGAPFSRDPGWRKRDTDGALRISSQDAARIGVLDGGRARITTASGSAEATVDVNDAMFQGHASLPNGFGLDFTDTDGKTVRGVAPNSLTSSEWRDEFAGTPWHKHVPARIEAL
jgi:predicted molibdopterin-dependent oxidoreductase YjgC